MAKPGTIGFTLAELLISLAILGVIAIFTIPKIVQAQQDERNLSIAKEMAGVILAANDAYLRETNNYTGNYDGRAITPYLNYVAVDSTSTLTGGIDCSSPCVVIHNGGMLRPQMCHFAGTATTNAIVLHFDPDGAGPSSPVAFWLYRNGLLRTAANIIPGTVNACNAGANPTSDPSWFRW